MKYAEYALRRAGTQNTENAQVHWQLQCSHMIMHRLLQSYFDQEFSTLSGEKQQAEAIWYWWRPFLWAIFPHSNNSTETWDSLKIGK